MKIALFSPAIISLKLGATKNRIELADALEKQGWETFLIGRDDIGINDLLNMELYNNALKDYLIKNADKYDVVLYEYNSLPFDRDIFSPTTLFVARPALLHYNHENIKIPERLINRLKFYTKQALKFDFNSVAKHKRIERKWAGISLKNSDVIQTQSERDKQLLISKGFAEDKIIVVPNGISKERFKLFDVQSNVSKSKDLCIAFVGTFDYRKGAMDFPYIVKEVKKKFPSAQFKLLGAKGFFPTEEDILSFFPKKFHKDIHVLLRFEPIELPKHLAECHLGIFPSYYESFGFGGLEMMAAGLPVISYNVSGPSDFAIPELLVPIGDKKLMAQKVIDLASDKNKLALFAMESKNRSKLYDWDGIGKHASDNYIKHLKKLRDSQ
jgi:glycosyltransferase involved in cell wall biosynthesis